MEKSVWNRLARQAICLLLAGKMGIITEKVNAEENMAQKYTRNMIRNVFIEMLDERPFDEITVTDLVTRCGNQPQDVLLLLSGFVRRADRDF